MATPVGDWYASHFDDAAWQEGRGGFGTNVPGHGLLETPWSTPDIWLRRSFKPGSLTAMRISRLVIRDYHDEDIEVYINGVPAYADGGFISTYEYKPLCKAASQSFIPNAENEIVVRCHQTGGGQYIDVGLYERIPKQK